MTLIDGFCFVYTLSHNGTIFYVGKTKNVAVRYGLHLNNRKDCELVKHIQGIIQIGELPKLCIITYCPDLEAWDVEHTLITCLTIGGQLLLNYVDTARKQFLSRKPPVIKKHAYLEIKEAQQVFVKKASTHSAYYRPHIRRINS